ncbi:MAG: SUMF1/EgtB/PvdO family nonheme iron enzyme [Pseudomonadota bacterium]
MTDVFISYSRQDQNSAEALAATLEAQGLNVFWDGHLVAGERWDERIDETLNAAKAVVVLWSDTSVRSRWVKDEASVGVDKGNLVPIALAGTIPPLGYRQIQAFAIDRPGKLADPATLEPILRRIEELTGLDYQPDDVAMTTPPKRRVWPIAAASLALVGTGLGAGGWLYLGGWHDTRSAGPSLSDTPPAAVLTETATLAPGTVFRDCDVCPQMVVVPAGQGVVGASLEDIRDGAAGDQTPQHGVVIPRPFAVSIAEITVAEYRALAATSSLPPPDTCNVFVEGQLGSRAGYSYENPGTPARDTDPATCVSWQDAQHYAEWLAEQTGLPYRLLSEAEWEYAARAGSETRFSFGDDLEDICTHYNTADESAGADHPGWQTAPCNDGHAGIAPVGSLAPNAFGLYDMIGNAWEWTADCWNETYNSAPIDGSAWLEGDCDRRVVRGGGWDIPPRDVRSSLRGKLPTDFHHGFYGFRVARDM